VQTVENRKSLGLCRWCGGVPRKGKVLCTDCALRDGNARKLRYKKRIFLGLCDCGQEVIPGKTYCKDHASAASMREKKRRDERRNLGLCTECGDSANKGTLCVGCHDRRVEQQKIRREIVNSKRRYLCCEVLGCGRPSVRHHDHEIQKLLGCCLNVEGCSQCQIAGLCWTHNGAFGMFNDDPAILKHFSEFYQQRKEEVLKC
jgi:hypothetical protein